MSDRTKIEWTDATWNPVRARDPKSGRVGWHCVKISPACTHCYAAEHNAKGRGGFGTKLPYAESSPAEVFLHERTLAKPLHWKRPRRIFVCSMTDLFGPWVDVAMLDEIYNVMAACPQHTFQVLTKRPDRMHRYHLNLAKRVAQIENNPVRWPLPNVWLGVTAEDQDRLNARLPWLLKTPATVRFLSCEPLLGPINLAQGGLEIYLNGWEEACTTNLQWIICGGESGRGRNIRPMHADWARFLRDQCHAGSIPYHFKQWGEFIHSSQLPYGLKCPTVDSVFLENRPGEFLQLEVFKAVTGGGRRRGTLYPWPDKSASARVGKKKAGRLLDGIEWNQFPSPALEAV